MKKSTYKKLLFILLPLILSSCADDNVEHTNEDFETCTHNLVFVPFTDSTCVKEGVVAHYICTKCEKMFEDESASKEISDVILEKKSHDFKFVSTTSPTCLDGGYSTYKCSNCNKEEYRDYTSALDHNFDETKTVHHSATCTGPGYDLCYCLTCQKEIACNFTETLGHLDSTSIGPVIHNPSCTEDGYTLHHCDRCGEDYITDKISKLGHDFDVSTKIEVDSTCESPGYVSYSCTRCEEKRIEYKEQLSHNFVDGTCSICHKPYQETTLIKAYDRLNSGEILPVNIHKDPTWDYIIDFKSDPSCDKNGDHYCLIELDLNVLSELKAQGISSLIFTPGSPDENVRAFAIEHENSFPAVNCGGETFATLSIEKPFLDENGNILKQYQESGLKFLMIHGRTLEESGVLPSFALKMEFGCFKHVPEEGSHVHVEPTCLTGGYDQYTCSKCNLTYKTNTVKPLGHDYQVVASYDEATCEHYKGEVTECSRCHDVITEILEEKTDHKFEEGKCIYCEKTLSEIDLIQALDSLNEPVEVSRVEYSYDVKAPLSDSYKSFVTIRKTILEEIVNSGFDYITLSFNTKNYEGRTVYIFEHEEDPYTSALAAANMWNDYASIPLSVIFKLTDNTGKLLEKYDDGIKVPVLAIALNSEETVGYGVDISLGTTNQIICASNVQFIDNVSGGIKVKTYAADYCFFAIDSNDLQGKTTITIIIDGSSACQPVSPLDTTAIGGVINGEGSYTVNISDFINNGMFYFGMYYNGTNEFNVTYLAE